MKNLLTKVFGNDNLSKNDKLILLCLYSLMDEQGKVSAGRELIAARAGLKKPQIVTKSTRRLQELGYINIHERYLESVNRRFCNEYSIILNQTQNELSEIINLLRAGMLWNVRKCFSYTDELTLCELINELVDKLEDHDYTSCYSHASKYRTHLGFEDYCPLIQLLLLAIPYELYLKWDSCFVYFIPEILIKYFGVDATYKEACLIYKACSGSFLCFNEILEKLQSRADKINNIIPYLIRTAENYISEKPSSYIDYTLSNDYAIKIDPYGLQRWSDIVMLPRRIFTRRLSKIH